MGPPEIPMAVAFPPQAPSVASVVCRTLEETAFLFAAPADEVAPFAGTPWAATLAFVGPAGEAGKLAIVAGPSLCTALAANLLGLEPEDPEAEVRGRDALGEICNITAGVLMAELFGAQAVCHLGIPHLEQLAGPLPGLTTLVTDEGERIDTGILAGPPGRS